MAQITFFSGGLYHLSGLSLLQTFWGRTLYLFGPILHPPYLAYFGVLIEEGQIK